jgi:mRNA interferase MazF
MTTGDIILVPFPYAELTTTKVRPAVVIGLTNDKYEDIIVSAISSVVPSKPKETEIVLTPNRTNNLRAQSVIKVDRIVTLKKENIIASLGRLTVTERNAFKSAFRSLVD